MAENIHDELRAIKEQLNRIEAMQQRLAAEELDIDEKTHQLLEDEETLKKKLTQMRFSDIMAWKEQIWERCQYKVSDIEAKTISYNCGKLNGPCRFEDCPVNQL